MIDSSGQLRSHHHSGVLDANRTGALTEAAESSADTLRTRVGSASAARADSRCAFACAAENAAQLRCKVEGQVGDVT